MQNTQKSRKNPNFKIGSLIKHSTLKQLGTGKIIGYDPNRNKYLVDEWTGKTVIDGLSYSGTLYSSLDLILIPKFQYLDHQDDTIYFLYYDQIHKLEFQEVESFEGVLTVDDFNGSEEIEEYIQEYFYEAEELTTEDMDEIYTYWTDFGGFDTVIPYITQPGALQEDIFKALTNSRLANVAA